jgi:protein arginine N-methyltransferase 2
LAISPALHVIIEPHPDVLEHMQANGWMDKSNVKVLKGKWQDLLEDPVIANANGFDVVYTDTFSEEYSGQS